MICSVLAFAMATPVASIAVAAPAPVNADLAQVQAHLRALDSMTAAFSQTDRNGKTVTGTLTLKKPGKIRFQYEKGVPILIVGDGKALWFIDYSVRQVQRWPIGNSPLGILINPDSDLARVAKIVPSADPRVLAVEAHDARHPEYGRITLSFARSAGSPAGLMLIGWMAIDAQSNRTTVRLSDVHFNGAVDSNAFRWNDPRLRAR
jgi:outer membrane lipoprotein-sorting protein